MWERLRLALDRRKADRTAKKQARKSTVRTDTVPKSAPNGSAIAWLTPICDALGAGRTALLNSLLFVAAVVIVIAFVRETINIAPIIHPVSLPDSLIKVGYSPEGMAASIRAETRELQRRVDDRSAVRTARGIQSASSSEAQPDIQLPGATFSLRAIVHWLHDQLGMPEPGIFAEIRCVHPMATAKSKRLSREAGKSEFACDPEHLNVDIVIADPEGRGTMRHIRLDDRRINEIDTLVAREVAFYFNPAMYGDYLKNEQDDGTAKCKPLDFKSTQQAYERAVLIGEREHGVLRRWISSGSSDLWEQGQLGLVGLLHTRADDLGATQDAEKLLKKAKEIASEVVDERPKSALARVALANTLFRLNPDDTSIETAFSAAERLAGPPQLAEVRANRANYYYFMGRYKDAIEQNRQALHQSPNLAVLHSNLGFSYLKAKKFDDALGAFEDARRLDPASSDWDGIGEALLRKREYTEAMASLKEAIKNRPCYAPALLLMAQAELESGHLALALDFARQASEKAPESYAEVYQVIAKAQSELMQQKNASESYERAIKLLKTGRAFDAADVAAKIYIDYADMIHESAGPEIPKMKRAESVLRDGIAANKERPKQLAILQNNLGIALSAQGRDVEAEKELISVTSADPQDSNALANLAYVRERLQHDDDALSAAGAAIAIDKDSAVASCVQGKVFSRRGQHVEADAAFSKAPELSRETCTTVKDARLPARANASLPGGVNATSEK